MKRTVSFGDLALVLRSNPLVLFALALILLAIAAGGCAPVTVQIGPSIGGDAQLMAVRNTTGLAGTMDVVAGEGLAVAGLPNGAMGVDPRSWQAHNQNLPILVLHRNEYGEVDAVATSSFSLSGWGTTQNIWDVNAGSLIPVGRYISPPARSATPARVRMRVPRVWTSGLAVLQVGLFRDGLSMTCTASSKKKPIFLRSGEWWAETFPAVGGRNGGVNHTLTCVLHHAHGDEVLPTFQFYAGDYRVDGHQFVVTPRGVTQWSP